MKKIFSLLMALPVLWFTACESNDYEMHTTYFYTPNPSGIMLYADQLSDTLHVISSDSWTARVVPADWLSVSPESETVPAGYLSDRRMELTATTNLSGKNRMAGIVVSANGNELTMPVYQSTWLNVTSPMPEIDQTVDFADRTAVFSMTIKPAAVDTVVAFRVYQDGATLQSDAAWATPAETVFPAGEHRVKVSFTPNAGVARDARLTLTSAGVSTEIKLQQSPAAP